MSTGVFRVQLPQLGTIEGCEGDVVAFCGVPYATLRDRLSEPLLKDQYESPIDATKSGPASPSPPGAFQLEMTLMQQNLPDPELVTSDTEQLNLNIWVPKQEDGGLPRANSLPVFVWIHGGGFVSGSASYPHYDLTELVRLSVELGKPIIGVGVNFRLGMLGLLTSNELRSTGYKPNNQLRDQQVALEWLRKHIADFGGAVDQITLAGESTGAVAVGLHFLAGEGIFSRAFLTGGTPMLMQPSVAGDNEWIYEQVLNALGLGSATTEQRIHSLLTLPMAEIMGKVAMPLPYRPMVDGDLIPYPITYSMVSAKDPKEIGARGWLKGLMVGDCQFDASSMAIFAAHKKPGVAQKFPQFMRQVLADHRPAVDELLAAYGFSNEQLDDEAGFKAFLSFINDIGYFAATYSFGKGWGPNTYTFLLNEKNPWSGMFQGQSMHVIDVTLLFQNFKNDLPPAMVEAGKQMAGDLFTFVWGSAPWPSKGTKVYGPSSWDAKATDATSKVVDDILAAETGRRRAMIDIGESIGFDKIASAYGAFMAS